MEMSKGGKKRRKLQASLSSSPIWQSEIFSAGDCYQQENCNLRVLSLEAVFIIMKAFEFWKIVCPTEHILYTGCEINV